MRRSRKQPDYFPYRSRSESLVVTGKFLAGWLNSDDGWGYPKETQAQLIKLVERFREMREKALAGTEIQKEEFGPINAELELHPWVLRLVGFTSTGTPQFFNRYPGGVTEQGQTWAEMILTIARAGLIDRLRLCKQCKLWFFARRPESESCSKKCRQDYYRSKPEKKARHRNQASKHYREHLSPYSRYYRKGLSPKQVMKLLKAKGRRRKHGH